MGPGGSNPRFMLFWFHIHYSALSVIFLRYKCISICAKVVHIAYQPISAEIYLLAAYSVLAQEYHVCHMRMGRHICFTALSDPANSLEIFLRCMCAGQHICCTALSDPALKYLGTPSVLADIYVLPLREIQS